MAAFLFDNRTIFSYNIKQVHMAVYRYIDDFTIGNTYTLVRPFDVLPKGESIDHVIWTVKANFADPDHAAFFEVHITTTQTASGIAIVNPDGSAQFTFIVQPSQSLLMDSYATYYYDIQLGFVSGDNYAVEYGKLFTGLMVTQVH